MSILSIYGYSLLYLHVYKVKKVKKLRRRSLIGIFWNEFFLSLKLMNEWMMHEIKSKKKRNIYIERNCNSNNDDDHHQVYIDWKSKIEMDHWKKNLVIKRMKVF